MEGDLHVEVADARDGGDNAREAAAPLGPGERLVVSGNYHGDRVLAGADGFLESRPSLFVLQRPVSAGGHKDLGGNRVSKSDGEVEGSLSIGNVAAINGCRDKVGCELRGNGFLLCVDFSGRGKAREGGN